MDSWLVEELMKGSTVTVIGGVLTILGAAVTLIGGYMSGQQKAATDKLLIAGNTVVQEKLDTTKDALIARDDELAKVQRELAATQVALVAKTDENAALSKKFSAYAMGEGSYVYLHARGFGGASPVARLVHVGENPVRDTEILVHDVTDQVPALAMRLVSRYDVESAPTKRVFLDATYPIRPSKINTPVFEVNPSREMYAYFIYVSGANGTYRQILQLVKVGEEWKQAYKVQAVVGDKKYLPIGEYFDQGFPDGALLQRSDEFPNLNAPD
jgi:hypothetical protein